MARHHREMRVDGVITPAVERALSGEGESAEAFLPPQYLQSEIISAAKACRPLINHMRIKEIPQSGQTLDTPKISAWSGAAGAQKNLGEVVDKDLTTEEVKNPVITLTGREDMARQLFDRMIPAVLDDLLVNVSEEIATKADLQALSGSGVSPNLEGIEGAAATNSAEWASEGTIKGLVKALAYAKWFTWSKRFLPATHVLFNPLTWAWIESLEDSSKRPLILPKDITAAEAAVLGQDADALVGTPQGKIGGMLAVLDANISTEVGSGKNEVPIFVGRPNDCTWWETQIPLVRVYEDVEDTLDKKMGVRIEVLQYAAMTKRYANAWTVITGAETVIAAPTI